MAENHSFNITFASKYGIEEAIIFDNIYHWCLHNKTKDINRNKDKEGNERYWTFNSCKNFADIFIYINPAKIRKVLIHLNELNFIIIDSFNKTKYDHTKWYAITEAGEKAFLECTTTITNNLYDKKSILQNEKSEVNEMENRKESNEKPIPTSNKTSETTSNKTSNSPSPDSDTQNVESAPTDSTASSPTPSNEVAELLDFVNEQTEINKQQAEENKELREDNKNLQEEVERLKKELTKKSKSSATSKYKKEDYTECAEIIKKNQELLLKNKRDISVVNYPVKTFNHLIKKCFDLYGVEDTKKGLINSVNFEWLINTTKYSLTALVADKTFPKCIANDFGAKYKTQPVKNPTTGSVNFDNQDYGEEVF